MRQRFWLHFAVLCAFVLSLGAPAQPTAAATLRPGVGPTLTNPILFVTQVPMVQGFGGIATTFGNHLGGLSPMGRGGDLWIRYGDYS